MLDKAQKDRQKQSCFVKVNNCCSPQLSPLQWVDCHIPTEFARLYLTPSSSQFLLLLWDFHFLNYFINYNHLWEVIAVQSTSIIKHYTFVRADSFTDLGSDIWEQLRLIYFVFLVPSSIQDMRLAFNKYLLIESMDEKVFLNTIPTLKPVSF